MPRTLLVFPTTDLVEEALAPPLESGRLGADFQRRAITISELEELILQPAMRGLARLPSGGRRLALNAQLQSASDLPAFRSVTRLPGFGRAVDAFLLDLAAGGIDATALDRMTSRLPPALAVRVGALARVALSYAADLESRGVGDAELVLGRACHALEQGGPLPHRLSGFDQVEFRHIVDWPPGRVALLRGLSAALGRVGCRVSVELPDSTHPEIQDAVEPALRALEGSGADIEITRRPLARIDPATVRAFTTAFEADECREVAARVAALISSGLTPDNVAVAARGMKELATPIDEALERHGIRTRRRRHRMYADTTVGRLAIDLARWGDPADQTRERVCAIVACDAVDLRRFTNGEISGLEIVTRVRAAAIRSRAGDRAGADGFASRLERLARSHEESGRHDDAAAAKKASVALTRLFVQLDAPPPFATMSEHASALLKLLDLLKVNHWLGRTTLRSDGAAVSTPDALESIDGRALADEQAAWLRLCAAMKEMEASTVQLGIDGRVVPRGAFADWLSGTLNTTAGRRTATRGSGVDLLELSDLAGRSFRHVFIMGAYEGRLPEPPSVDSLFTEEERWTLNTAFGRPVLRVSPSTDAQSPLPSASLLDAAALALAVESARESLTVSRPRSDSRGRPLAQSPLLSLIASPLQFDRIAYAPADAMLSSRTSASIEQRRVIATTRAAIFRGEAHPDAHSGDLSSVAALIQPLAAGSIERPWSASTLERLASCHFRYLAEWAWRAKEEDEPDDQAGPLEVGRLAHLAAETAVKAMVDANLWSLSHSEAALDIGLTAATKVIAASERSTVVGHPELWELTRDRMLRRLRALLQFELERTAAEDVKPFGMELSFGLDKSDPLPSYEIAGVRVAGQIDRVDVGPRSISILDYKSGKTTYNTKRFADEALFEVQLQLPLYVAAIRELLPGARDKEIDAAYVSLRDTKRTDTLREAMGGASVDEIQQRLEAAVTRIVDHVRTGQFPVSPRSCRGCHLQPACRIPRTEDA